MKVKQRIQYLFGYIRCRANHISAQFQSKIYIGKDVKIEGGIRLL